MSLITVNENKPQKSEAKLEAVQEQGWYDFGMAVGYPENWVSLLNEGLVTKGKVWRWNAV